MYSRTGDEDEIKNEIIERVLGGWLVVSGNEELIELFERSVYPPNTVKKSDFLLYLGQYLGRKKGKIGYLYLARKNEDLHRFLRRFDNTLTDEEWERAIEIRLEPVIVPDADMAVVITFAKEPTTTPKDVRELMEGLI